MGRLINHQQRQAIVGYLAAGNSIWDLAEVLLDNTSDEYKERLLHTVETYCLETDQFITDYVKLGAELEEDRNTPCVG